MRFLARECILCAEGVHRHSGVIEDKGPTGSTESGRRGGEPCVRLLGLLHPSLDGRCVLPEAVLEATGDLLEVTHATCAGRLAALRLQAPVV